MILTRPNQGERHCHAMHFAFLVPTAEATGPLHLWPGQGAAVEADIAAWVDETKAALVEGRVWPYRLKVISGTPPTATVDRAWSWCDAVGREVEREPIDAAPIPWTEAQEWHWPETPKSRVIPNLVRKAA